jgi:hypothetical protein
MGDILIILSTVSAKWGFDRGASWFMSVPPEILFDALNHD